MPNTVAAIEDRIVTDAGGPPVSFKTNPKIERESNDLISSIVLSSTTGGDSNTIGWGIPSLNGLLADQALKSFIQTRDELEGFDSKTLVGKTPADYEASLTEEDKMWMREVGATFGDAKDAVEAHQIFRTQQYRNSYLTTYNPNIDTPSALGVATLNFLTSAIGDPSNWVAAGATAVAKKVTTTGVVRAAAATALGRSAMRTSLGARLGSNALINGTLTLPKWMTMMPDSRLANIVTNQWTTNIAFNAAQSGAAALDTSEAMNHLYGVDLSDGTDVAMGTAMGAAFGVGIPAVGAGLAYGLGYVGSTPTAKRTINKVQKVMQKITNNSPAAPKIYSGALAVPDAITRVGMVKELAYHFEQMGDPNFEVTRWADQAWWDKVKPSGFTPERLLKTLSEGKFNKDEARKLLDSVEEIAIVRQDATVNGKIHQDLNKRFDDLVDKTLRVRGATIGVSKSNSVNGYNNNRNLRWLVENFRSQLLSGDSTLTPDQVNEQAADLGVLYAMRAAQMGISTDEFIQRVVDRFAIDEKPGRGALYSTNSIRWNQVIRPSYMPEGFYSPVIKAIQFDMPPKMKVADLQKWIAGRPGIKKEEVDWILGDFFKYANPNEVVTRQDVLSRGLDPSRPLSVSTVVLNSDNGEARYESFLTKSFTKGDTLGYQEVLFTYPKRENFVVDVRTPHWSEQPNIVGSALVRTVEDYDGVVTLHIEEIQSDLHQIARDKGYSPVREAEDGSGVITTDAQTEAGSGYGIYRSPDSPQPPALPYSSTYYELALKWALHHAATQGIKRISLNRAETLHRRWGGSIENWELYYDKKYVQSLEKLGKKYGFTVEQRDITAKHVSTGIENVARYTPIDDISAEARAALDRAIEDSREYTNLITPHTGLAQRLYTQWDRLGDLRDSIADAHTNGLPARNVTDDIVQILSDIDLIIEDHFVGTGDILIRLDPDIREFTIRSMFPERTPEYGYDDATSATRLISSITTFLSGNSNYLSLSRLMELDERLPSAQTIRDLRNAVFDDVISTAKIDDNGLSTVPAHVINLPEETAVLLQNEGLPLFQRSGSDIKAAVTFDGKDGRATIYAFSNATDFSSLVHETGHIFRRTLDKELLLKAAKWAGAGTDPYNWSREAEEKFARAFEKYVRNGKSPNSDMTAAFKHMRQVMVNIYQTVKGSEIDVRWSKDLQDTFDEMLAGVHSEAVDGPTIDGSPVTRTVRVGDDLSSVDDNPVPPPDERRTGIIRMTVSGNAERALLVLLKGKERETRLASLLWLRDNLQVSDKEIYAMAGRLRKEIAGKVAEARRSLRRAVRRDPKTGLPIKDPSGKTGQFTDKDGVPIKTTTRGVPYTVIDIPAGTAASYKNLTPLDAERVTYPAAAAREFVDTENPTSVLQERLEALEASQRRRQDLTSVDSIADTVQNQTRRGVVNATKPFDQKTRTNPGAPVLTLVQHGLPEKPRGSVVKPDEAVMIFNNVINALGKFNKDWLVRNTSKAMAVLRKVGNTLWSTGVLDTVGSMNPIIAHLAKMIDSNTVFNDDYGHATGFSGPGLVQHKHMAVGRAARLTDSVLQILDKHQISPESAIEQAIIRDAMWIANGGEKTKTYHPASVELATMLETFYGEVGNRGLVNGYFRSLNDHYSGTFNISRSMRRPVDLGVALFNYWLKKFDPDLADPSIAGPKLTPLHNFTARRVTGLIVQDPVTGLYVFNPDRYKGAQPTVFEELEPVDQANYLAALRDTSLDTKGEPVGGLYYQSVIAAQRKMGITVDKFKEAEAIAQGVADVRMARAIDVDVWFDPEVSKFVDWSPESMFHNYAERTLYAVYEKDVVNRMIAALTGVSRKDFDMDNMLHGIKTSLLQDTTLTPPERTAIETAFSYIENHASNLRGDFTKDIVREQGPMGYMADITSNIARTAISSRTATASVFTEAMPFFIAAAYQSPQHFGRLIMDILSGATKRELRSIIEGHLHQISHLPFVLSTVANTESFNRSWFDKTFKNPLRNVSAAARDPNKRIANTLLATTSAMHRMAAGLGLEDLAQSAVAGSVTSHASIRLVDMWPKIGKLIEAMQKNPDLINDEKRFTALARDAGFGEETQYAVRLNKAGLLDPQVYNKIIDLDNQLGGKLLDPENGRLSIDLLEPLVTSKDWEVQNIIDLIANFKQEEVRRWVVTPSVQNIYAPKGGASPWDRMSNMFFGFQRSWFNQVMMNHFANEKLHYMAGMLGLAVIGEALYYHAYTLLYREETIEDLKEQWEESPFMMIAQMSARTNFLGSAASIGQITLDALTENARGFGTNSGPYAMSNAFRVLSSIRNIAYAALSSDKEVAVKDARRVENMLPGVNAWWFRALLEMTGASSFSDLIYGNTVPDNPYE